MAEAVGRILVETHDVGKLENLHGGELVTLPAIRATEREGFVKADELLHFRRPHFVFVKQVKEPEQRKLLVKVVTFGMGNNGLGISRESLVDAPQLIPLDVNAREAGSHVHLALPVPLLLFLCHPSTVNNTTHERPQGVAAVILHLGLVAVGPATHIDHDP